MGFKEDCKTIQNAVFQRFSRWLADGYTAKIVNMKWFAGASVTSLGNGTV